MTGGLNRWLLGWLLVALTAGVCPAQYFQGLPQAPTPTEPAMPGSARVAQLLGDVSVLKGSEPWALNVGDTVRPREVILTGPDSFAVFELEDAGYSSVSYQNNFMSRETGLDYGCMTNRMIVTAEKNPD